MTIGYESRPVLAHTPPGASVGLPGIARAKDGTVERGQVPLGTEGSVYFTRRNRFLLLPRRDERPPYREAPPNQNRDHQQHQLQAPEDGVCFAWLGPGLPMPLAFGLSLSLQQFPRGCGAELGYQFLFHETSVNGWLEDLQLLATADQVH